MTIRQYAGDVPPLTSSPEQPQPLRVVLAGVKNWVERCGTVWVTGQLIELKRRSGAATHFLTLRDALAEVSVTVTASTSSRFLLRPKKAMPPTISE